MNQTPPSSRGHLIDLIEQGALPTGNIPAALTLTQVHPDNIHWRVFISNLLLWLGSLALAFAVMFFIAYNWDNLGRFAKFALVQAFIAIAIAAFWKLHPSTIAKSALLVASIGLGVLLALYGQTYQTGADPWQLFFNWALLMLPWALIARFAAIWILWLALINLVCVLYPLKGLFGGIFFSGNDVLWTLFFINTMALIVWEILVPKMRWLDEQWAKRLIAVGSGASITQLAVMNIFEAGSVPVASISWLISCAALFFYYRKIKLDLFMLAGGCLSAIIVTVSFVADWLMNLSEPVGGFFLLTLLTIGMSGTAAAWLRKVHQEQLS